MTDNHVAASLETASLETDNGAGRRFRLPPLPYGYADLEPAMSEATLRTHHGKHHARYVEAVNAIVAAEDRPIHDLADVVRDAAHRKAVALFNNAAQAWNHGFFWDCMAPARSRPEGLLAGAIETDFGDIDALKIRFLAEGTSHFGSGWVWLIARGPALSVISTHDAATPLTIDGATPLLVCDLWEHAYYLDYRQDRAAWLVAWWDRLANWQLADRQYAAALGRGVRWHYPAAA